MLSFSTSSIPKRLVSYSPKWNNFVKLLAILCLTYVLLYFLLRFNACKTIKPDAGDHNLSFKEMQDFLIRAIREMDPTFAIPGEKYLLKNLSGYNNGSRSWQICPKICRIHNATIPKKLNRTDPLELRPTVPLITAKPSFHSNTTWSGLYPGGLWSPYSVDKSNCTRQSGLAIIIPFRNRHHQLNTMLPILHQGLRRQGVCYQIFVVEQAGDDLFNRGGTSNVGFLEAATRFQFDCVLFHDTDLVPMNPRIPYACSQDPNEPPLHMSANVSQFNWKLLYQGIVGGVLRISTAQFLRVNGYSNMYWGWGGEDDDFRARLGKMGLNFKRLPGDVGVYYSLPHPTALKNPQIRRRTLSHLRTASTRIMFDGLLQLRYELIEARLTPSLTWLVVKLEHRKEENEET